MIKEACNRCCSRDFKEVGNDVVCNYCGQTETREDWELIGWRELSVNKPFFSGTIHVYGKEIGRTMANWDSERQTCDNSLATHWLRVPDPTKQIKMTKDVKMEKKSIINETARFTIYQLKELFKKGEYSLYKEDEFNKNWDNKKKSMLIESLLLNIPMISVKLNEYEYGKYEIFDGREMVKSILEFMSGDFKLEGLEVMSELNGLDYEAFCRLQAQKLCCLLNQYCLYITITD